MNSLIIGDLKKNEKIVDIFRKFGFKVSFLLYIAGLCWFFVLPYKDYVHKTYVSENALLPGLVNSDILSSEDLFKFYDRLKKDREESKFDASLIETLFKSIGVETYSQNFNVTNPFYNRFFSKRQDKFIDKNVYAIVRSHRTPNIESIIVTAPLKYFDDEKGEDLPNLLGVSQLLTLAKLAKSSSYWAKDLIFVVTGGGHFGIEAWLNAYFNKDSSTSSFIEREDLAARGGSIQAALNIEVSEPHADKYLIKLEGANGQLPNLDLFNTIIRICKNQDFKCGFKNLASQAQDSYQHSLENLLIMMFNQLSGVPTASHGYFLKHHIEALTLQGVKESDRQIKNFKYNSLKLVRIVEGTLRSVNNLLERFHQSFFFYLMPSENFYISIGMYMPPLGLLIAPIVIQILALWFESFHMKFDLRDRSIKFDLIRITLPCVVVPIIVSMFNYAGTNYLSQVAIALDLDPKDSLVFITVLMGLNSLIVTPFLAYNKIAEYKGSKEYKDQVKEILETLRWNITKLIALISLLVVLGSLSLLNYSLSVLLSIVFVPISCFITRATSKLSFKFLTQLSLLLVICPYILFSLVYLLYSVYSNTFHLDNFYADLSVRFYEFVFLSKTSNIWTCELINLAVLPIWTLLWILNFK